MRRFISGTLQQQLNFYRELIAADKTISQTDALDRFRAVTNIVGTRACYQLARYEYIGFTVQEMWDRMDPFTAEKVKYVYYLAALSPTLSVENLRRGVLSRFGAKLNDILLRYFADRGTEAAPIDAQEQLNKLCNGVQIHGFFDQTG